MKKTIILALILLGNFALSQAKLIDPNTLSKTNTESLVVTINNQELLTGETIYYTIQVQSSFKSDLDIMSKIVYVEIISSDFKSIKKQKHQFVDGFTYGEMFLPTDIKTGNYKFICYTSQILNQNRNDIISKDITIINPYTELKEYINPEATYLVNNKESNADFLKNKNYDTRQKVALNLNDKSFTNNKNITSVSVFKKNTYATSIQTENTATPSAAKANSIYVPEFRGEIIGGKISPKEPNFSVNGISIALSIPGEDFIYKNVNTNSKGEFYFLIDKNNYIEEAYLQIIEPNNLMYTIELNEPKIDYSFLNFNSTLSIDKKQLENIKKAAISSQIENAYFEIKKDTLKDIQSNNSFYFSNKTVYNLDDYKRFNTLKEVIFEVLPYVYTMEIKGKRKIYLRDESNNSSGNSLVLLNGFLVQDIDTFFEFNAREIDRVEFVKESYGYGANIYKGIINFITKTNNPEYYQKEGVFNFKLQRPAFRKNYFKQSYSETNIDSRVPDYRTQLLWLPKVDEKEISFYTSDEKGSFIVKIEGTDSDGNPFELIDTFEVN